MPDTHSHRHTHSLAHTDPVVDAYPHSHTNAAGRDDSHPHQHRIGDHVHLGDALGLPEYWRRRIRWWFVQRLDHGPSRGRRSTVRRWWRVRLVDYCDQFIRWCRSSGSPNSGIVLVGEAAREVNCSTCRSMGMMGMAMMFGIPMPCPACAIGEKKV